MGCVLNAPLLSVIRNHTIYNVCNASIKHTYNPKYISKYLRIRGYISIEAHYPVSQRRNMDISLSIIHIKDQIRVVHSQV